MSKIYSVKSSVWYFHVYKYLHCTSLRIYFILWYLFNILHVVYRKFRYSPFIWGPYYRVVWWRSLGALFKLFYQTHLDYYLFIYNLFRYSFIFQGLNLIVFPIVCGFIFSWVALIEPHLFLLSLDSPGGVFWVVLQNTVLVLFYIMNLLLDNCLWLGTSFFVIVTFITIPLTFFFSVAFLNILGLVFCCLVLCRILFFYSLSVGLTRGFRLFSYIFVS